MKLSVKNDILEQIKMLYRASPLQPLCKCRSRVWVKEGKDRWVSIGQILCRWLLFPVTLKLRILQSLGDVSYLLPSQWSPFLTIQISHLAVAQVIPHLAQSKCDSWIRSGRWPGPWIAHGQSRENIFTRLSLLAAANTNQFYPPDSMFSDNILI